jgi:hypothetical protein
MVPEISLVACLGVVRKFVGAKRLEGAELAAALRAPRSNESASKLDALQTPRAKRMPKRLAPTGDT